MGGPQGKELLGLVADATGRSEEELKLFIATTAVSAVLAGAAVTYLGVVRLKEFLREG